MRFSATVLPAVLAWCSLASAGALPASYVPVRDIQRGMKGYGLSVFQGTKIERFQVEVIGVLRNAFPKQHIVLARMSGAGLEKTGIIAGMSGSPIYLRVGDADKLAGAVAYGWSFPKEPVCGITPFENMYGVITSTEPEKKAAAKPKLDGPITLGKRTLSDVTLASGPPSWDKLSGNAAQLFRLRTPLTVSGLSEPAFAMAREEFGKLGFLPVQGGGSGDAPAEAPQKLAPGSALSIVLARGDLDMSGVGTCTEVIGDTVLGFGHPMFGEGRVSVPMATAVVHFCYPSLMRSFKMASPGRVVGTLTADMQAAVMGKVGPAPRMIPMDVKLRRTDMQGEQSFKCEAFDHPRLSSRIAGMFLFNSLVTRGDFPRENTVSYRATIRLAGRPPIQAANVYSGFSSMRSLFGAVNDIVSPLAVLADNKFGKVKVEGISAEFEVTAKATTATLEAIRLERNDYAPGETLRILATLKPKDGEPVVHTLAMKLPDDLPAGTATVMVCDAAASHSLDRTEAPHRYQPQDLDQLVEMLREQVPARRLYIRMGLPDKGVAMRGVEMPSLPQSIFPIIGSAKTTGLSLTRRSVTAHIETPFVVTGRHALQVLIRPR